MYRMHIIHAMCYTHPINHPINQRHLEAYIIPFLGGRFPAFNQCHKAYWRWVSCWVCHNNGMFIYIYIYKVILKKIEYGRFMNIEVVMFWHVLTRPHSMSALLFCIYIYTLQESNMAIEQLPSMIFLRTLPFFGIFQPATFDYQKGNPIAYSYGSISAYIWNCIPQVATGVMWSY